jgi:hypothetical protein
MKDSEKIGMEQSDPDVENLGLILWCGAGCGVTCLRYALRIITTRKSVQWLMALTYIDGHMNVAQRMSLANPRSSPSKLYLRPLSYVDLKVQIAQHQGLRPVFPPPNLTKSKE